MASLQDVINPITITNYGRGYVDNVVMKFPFFRLLKKYGQIERNVGGTNFTWEIEAGRHDPQIVSDDQDVSTYYTPRKRFAQPTLNWGQIAVFRRFGKGQLRQNYGPQALVNIRNTEIKTMFRDAFDAQNGLMWQWWNMNGGTYTGTGLPMYGMPSVMSSGTITWSSTSQFGSFAAAGTYASLPLASGAMSAYVDGAQADAWTPSAINATAPVYANTGTAGFLGTDTLPNCFGILSAAWQQADRFSGGKNPDFRPDCFFLCQDWFRKLERALTGKQQFLLTQRTESDDEFGLGAYNDQLYHNGKPVYWDANMPDQQGFVLNFKQIGWKMQPRISAISADESEMKADSDEDGESGAPNDWFEIEQTYGDDRRTVRVSATLAGQLWMNPRYQVGIFNGT